MSSEVEYIIDYQGLSIGEHTFTFDLGDALFAADEFCEINHVAGLARVDMQRDTTMLELCVNITAKVELPCDRCLDDFWLPVEWNSQVVVKFSEQKGEDDGDIIWLSAGEKLDLSQYIHDSIILALPIVRHHESLELCNADMIKRFSIEQ
ncbi:MAG: DUF177 domain-containing protein [Mucinivorans sp.]